MSSTTRKRKTQEISEESLPKESSSSSKEEAHLEDEEHIQKLKLRRQARSILDSVLDNKNLKNDVEQIIKNKEIKMSDVDDTKMFDTKVSKAEIIKADSFNESVIRTVIKEIISQPELALEFVNTLSKITRNWEVIGVGGSLVNEMPVPPGKSAKEFMKNTYSNSYISGYKLRTIFGEEVATIIKDSPKWKVTILGETQVEAPFISHAQHGDQNAKVFVKQKLESLGYILP